MKGIVMTLTAAVMLSACAAGSDKEVSQTVGMANPASVFCVEQGGRLEVKKDKDGGEYALCHLPDGQVVEEWAHFRANNK